MDASIWVAVLGSVSTLLTILLTQAYTKNSSLRAELRGKKQRLYAEYVDFIYVAYAGDFDDAPKIIAKFKTYYPKLLTFASNEVVKNAGDFMQHLFKYDQSAVDRGDSSWNIQSMEYFGDLILAIRKDLGHKKFLQIMKWHDIARLWITDIDAYVPKTERTPRAVHLGPSPKEHS